MLKQTVGKGIHKQGGLTNAIGTVDHCHSDGGKIKGRIGVAAVIADGDGDGDECAGVFAGISSIVGLCQNGPGQLLQAGAGFKRDFVQIQPAFQRLGGTVVFGQLIDGIQCHDFLREDFGNIECTGLHNGFLQFCPVEGLVLFSGAVVTDTNDGTLDLNGE